MSSLSPQEAAHLLGVTVKTLHRWEADGKIKSTRTLGGHRRYDITDLIGNKTGNELTVGYARVSNHDQKDNLTRQVLVLESYCAKNGWEFEIIQDLGSGINYKKKGLIRLIKLITSYQVERLVLTNKDRLLRFGSDLIFTLCESFGTEVIIINRSDDSTFEEDLTADVLEIITVFSARLYGSRSHQNKKIVEELREIAKKL
ncbi:IS607 family transposase [Limnofasciculus baicalensis]|uniref:IS607 family transposase n=1 Tax=Limnofasciculus baicalensis BBK-W-15 TaxID=2699891 RepID=A0AAE3GNV4_9CYAN|nr:IS607 family transposase [Limnofasciculus baicalensis]MCP2727819.1 IS607 family transposase [Limnofasciculus baicalensis BBK-W-15]